MARMARLKVENGQGWYHIHSSTAGIRGDYPLDNPLCQKKLIDLWQKYSALYFCEVSSFCVMGNHYHLVVRFDKPWSVDRDQLTMIAKRFYPSGLMHRQIDHWSELQWQRFERRLFDVSEFMRNIQSEFAKWYNRAHNRKGRFWADRFKSSCLGDLGAVMDCMLYVDLNPIRAGMVERPELFNGSSLYYRDRGECLWLMPLLKLYTNKTEKAAYANYRCRLYYRGRIPTKPGQKRLSESILADEISRGFDEEGQYLERLRYFSDSLAVGTESYIESQLVITQSKGYYLHRTGAISPKKGYHKTLREQRNTEVPA